MKGFIPDEKPVKVGETYTVLIDDVGSRGDGIARISNLVIFVPGTAKGQKVRVKITEVRERFAVGEVVETEEVVAEEPAEIEVTEAAEEKESEGSEEKEPE